MSFITLILGIRDTEPDSEGLRALLQRRLLLGSVIGSFGASARMIMLLVGFGLRSTLPLMQRLQDVAGFLGFVTLALILWRRRSLSLVSLRGVELLLFSMVSAYFYSATFGTISNVQSVAWSPPSEVQSILSQHIWLVYASGAAATEHLYLSTGAFVSVNFGLLMMAYGVFIPNTWHRCLVVLVLMLALAEVCVVHAVLQAPALQPNLFRMFWFVFYVTGTFAAFSLYGCSKLTAFREAAGRSLQVGQYTLEERLGQGGMGEVFRARHRMLRRPCAVKLIRQDQAGSSSILARFEREVQAMAQLTHPNTVEIYDYGRTIDGTLYYVMEYLPGMTLEQLVRRHGPLAPGRAVYLLSQACRALREAHKAGLIHRDIKPGNIYVTHRGGEFDIVKLLDFGLVRVQGMDESGEQLPTPQASTQAGTHAEHANLTQAGHILGTPAFLSPEQGEGKALDSRSDIYSLGTVAYFVLTGRPPFERSSLAELLQAHLQAQNRNPAELNSAVPSDLSSIVLRCLAKLPEDRYPSASALAEALAGCACSGSWDATRAEAWWRNLPAETPQPSGSAPAESDALSALNTVDSDR